MYQREPILQRTVQNGATIQTLQLRPLPLSHIAFTYIADTTASFDPLRTTETIIRDLASITLRSHGQTFIETRGDDLFELNALYWGYTPHSPHRGGDNLTARGAYTVLLPLGRKLYDPNECLPAQPPYALELSYELIAEPGNVTTRTIEIEAVYLPDANPNQHLRYQQQAPNQLVVGSTNDVILPRGNTLLAVLLQQDGPAILAGSENTIQRLTLLLDSQEKIIRDTDFYALWAETKYRQAVRFLDAEQAIENVAAAYAQNAETRDIRAIAGIGSTETPLYALMDIDPTRDGTHALDTRAFGEVQLRIEAGQAVNIRLTPVELVTS